MSKKSLVREAHEWLANGQQFKQARDIPQNLILRALEVPEVLWKFHNSYVVNPLTQCWEWKKIYGAGCGFFPLFGFSLIAYRISWMLANTKEIPDKYDICHECDNRACANPEHLFLGTRQENLQDMFQKGRAGKRGRKSKLTAEMVRKIRTSELPLSVLGREFGVKPQIIYAAKVGASWAHMTDPAPVLSPLNRYANKVGLTKTDSSEWLEFQKWKAAKKNA